MGRVRGDWDQVEGEGEGEGYASSEGGAEDWGEVGSEGEGGGGVWN